jgi:hypothetical protein
VSAHPPLPVPDEVSKPFWDGVSNRRLLVQQCTQCHQYQFPPRDVCGQCRQAEPPFVEVSGRGTVFSFTETVSGARHPYFQSISPYLVGHVELLEQKGLIFASNFPGSTYDELAVGAPVELVFCEIAAGVLLPQFRLSNTTSEVDD